MIKSKFFLTLVLITLILSTAACSMFGGNNSNAPAPTTPPYTPLPTFAPPPAAASSTPGVAANAPLATAAPPAAQEPSSTAQALLPNTAASPTPEAAQPAQGRPANASALPDASGYDWKPFASGLDQPVGLYSAHDGSGRLFVLERPGTIRIVKDGQALETPFLDIRDRVGSLGSEQGLLGLAFHPQYQQNGYFYVNYTDKNGNTHISRFRVSADANVADPASEKQILFVQQPYPNHNGGSLAFGTDGYLYIGLGDGGSEGDPNLTGQSLDTLLAKLLRIDVDHGDPYTIPADNPFANGGGKPEIWAYGLRNPWRFSFDALTGDLYIGDVGQDTWEEVDYLPAGSPGGTNFGWSYREGKHPYKGQPPAGIKLTDPVAEYDHSFGCAIAGGDVYRGVNLPDWEGVYFYGDDCTGNIWGLLKTTNGWQNALLFKTDAHISAFGSDENGNLYVVDLTGNLFLLDKK